MADEKAQLLALPARYADLQEADQVAEELSVQLNLLPTASCASFSFSIATGRSSLLLGSDSNPARRQTAMTASESPVPWRRA